MNNGNKNKNKNTNNKNNNNIKIITIIMTVTASRTLNNTLHRTQLKLTKCHTKHHENNKRFSFCLKVLSEITHAANLSLCIRLALRPTYSNPSKETERGGKTEQILFLVYQTPMEGKEAGNEGGGRQIRMINERDEGDGGGMREDQRGRIREAYDKRRN